ncbi:MAG: YqgE/AlgH family protein [Planctomycetaceae bacterium]|jgi:putative transcriptional regulator
MSDCLDGEFLIAADHLREQNFYRTVVLILEHNDDGAMGLVVNRPSSIAVDAALGGKSPLSLDAPVFIGGPVETSALFVLHNHLRPGLQDREVVPGLFLAGSDDSLHAVVNPDSQTDQHGHFRVYCGYAGWGSEQLESEISRGDWLSVPADSGTVLEEDPYGIWEVCTRRFRRAHRILPHNVRNPEWN